MNKKELVEKINSLDVLSSEEKTALVDLLKQKKYGLVWEDKPENVEERLRAELPVLREVKDKAIVNIPPKGGLGGSPLLVYVFSTNNYAMDADFEDVADNVTLCALSAAIYNAYLKVLPKKGEPKLIVEEEDGE